MKDKFIITDLDGTLLTSDKKLTDRNIEAINRFRNDGGSFTIATGRSYDMCRPYAEKLKLDLPVIIYHGAVICDYKNDDFLWKYTLPNKARDYVKLVMEKFDDIGIEILLDKTIYIVSMNEYEKTHLSWTGVDYIRCSLDEVPDGWIKVLFAMNGSRIPALAKTLNEKCADGVDYIRSDDWFYEMLPQNINKGLAMKKLLELTGKTDAYTIGIGDFMNDLELIKMADLGVAVASAEPEVKEAADMVVGTNDESGVADVIDYLYKNIK